MWGFHVSTELVGCILAYGSSILAVAAFDGGQPVGAEDDTMTDTHRRLAVLVGLAAGIACCSGAQHSGSLQGTASGQGAGGVGHGGNTSGEPGRIEGEVERTDRRKRMHIWGKVERIRNSAHGELPPLTATPSGTGGDPVTKIRNQTQFKLTIWFAGKCSHEVEVPAATDVTAAFCAGRYNLAAAVDDSGFLPLVREDQDFENGVQYLLEFFVKKPPR